MQLIVYASAQIPVGVLIDRYGPRALMLSGTALMIAGQFTLAFSPSIAVAVFGRILVGAGDATIFISVIRLVSSWFTPRLVPQMSQWMGNLGQLGQVLSAVPLAWLLHMWGWTPAFVSAGSVAVIAFIVILIFIKNRPSGSADIGAPADWKTALAHLRHSLARPGTQLGFWSH